MSASGETNASREACFVLGCQQDAATWFECPACPEEQRSRYMLCEAHVFGHQCHFCRRAAAPEDFRPDADRHSSQGRSAAAAAGPARLPSDVLANSLEELVGNLEGRVATLELTVYRTEPPASASASASAAAAGAPLAGQALEAEVLAALRRASPDSVGGQSLARACGFEAKRDINKALYDMQSQGLIRRTTSDISERDPQWLLAASETTGNSPAAPPPAPPAAPAGAAAAPLAGDEQALEAAVMDELRKASPEAVGSRSLAQACGCRSKKDFNRLLYAMAARGRIRRTSGVGEPDPRWVLSPADAAGGAAAAS